MGSVLLEPMSAKPALLPLGQTARLLQVPAAWLRAEAEAGRLPHLKAGKALLFDVDSVEQILIERARMGGKAVANA
jgi:hypothetical protein